TPRDPHRREQPTFDLEVVRDFTLDIPPVEPLVPVVRERSRGSRARVEDARHRQTGDGADHFGRRVALAVRIVAEAAKAGDGADTLLDQKTRPGLDRHADDDAPVRRADRGERFENAPPLALETVLEHF